MNSTDEKGPLKKKKKPKNNGKDELYKKNLQKCFLCDEVLYNNYEVLVHNARHIIIPVQKYECHQCRECLTQFITKQELYLHVLNGHPEIINATTDDPPVNIKHDKTTLKLTNNNLVNGIEKDEKTAIDLSNDLLLVSRGIALNTSTECITDDLPVVNDKEFINAYVDRKQEEFHEDVKLKTETIDIIDSDDDLKSDHVDDSKSDILSVIENMVKKQPIILCKTPLQINSQATKSINYNAIENTVTDYSNNIVLENLVNKNCVVVCNSAEDVNQKVESKITVFSHNSPVKPFNDTISSGMIGTPLGLKDKIVFEDDTDEVYQNDMLLCQRFLIGSKKPELFSPSIHFDDLKLPNYYKCRYCKHVSKNRYDSIIHDTVHITTKTRIRGLLCVICDRIIAGHYRSLRRHEKTSHPDNKNVNRLKHHKCIKCNLRYHNLTKHVRLYHNQYRCTKCKEGFMMKSMLNKHAESCSTVSKVDTTGDDMDHRVERLVKMCEVCFMLRRTSVRRKYVYIDTISDIGKKQECYQCHKKTFSMRLVKLITIKKLGFNNQKNSKWTSSAMAKIEHSMKSKANYKNQTYGKRNHNATNQLVFSVSICR